MNLDLVVVLLKNKRKEINMWINRHKQRVKGMYFTKTF